MKVAEVGAGLEKAAPEYVDCKKIANRTDRPLIPYFFGGGTAFTVRPVCIASVRALVR